jgi:SHS2 domain-containing protein
MPYGFLDDLATADVAFEATGAELEEVFLAAARATLNTMVDRLGSIAAVSSRQVELHNSALDLLLFDYLQELIYYKDAEGLLLLPRELQIQEEKGGFRLSGIVEGEEIDSARHELRVDVKAVTLHQFELEQTPSGWRAVVILDV